eukprot:jgi/Galph1/5760/GphlegSOOS_G4331.1
MIREEEITKAIRFLEHPQVKPTTGQRKVEFLRKKGLTQEEIKEAFQRTGQAFPEDNFATGNDAIAAVDTNPAASNAQANSDKQQQVATSGAASKNQEVSVINTYSKYTNRVWIVGGATTGAFWVPHNLAYVPSYPLNAQQQEQVREQKSKSWSFGNIFLGAGATAGIVLVLRELLKKYVVPLYFPQAVQNYKKDRPNLEREERRGMDTFEDEIASLKTQVANLMKVTERNNEILEEVIRKTEGQNREELFEVVHALKSVVSSFHTLSQSMTHAKHSSPLASSADNQLSMFPGTNSRNTERQNLNVANTMNGYPSGHEPEPLAVDKDRNWSSRTSWLFGQDENFPNSNSLGTQIFSERTRPSNLMEDFMSIPPASIEEIIPKQSNKANPNGLHLEDNKNYESEEHHKSINSYSNYTEKENGTTTKKAKKAFQQAMLAEARAALQKKSQPISSSRSSPTRSVDNEVQN